VAARTDWTEGREGLKGMKNLFDSFGFQPVDM
jgi:hypothetical protein